MDPKPNTERVSNVLFNGVFGCGECLNEGEKVLQREKGSEGSIHKQSRDKDIWPCGSISWEGYWGWTWTPLVLLNTSTRLWFFVLITCIVFCSGRKNYSCKHDNSPWYTGTWLTRGFKVQKTLLWCARVFSGLWKKHIIGRVQELAALLQYALQQFASQVLKTLDVAPSKSWWIWPSSVNSSFVHGVQKI